MKKEYLRLANRHLLTIAMDMKGLLEVATLNNTSCRLATIVVHDTAQSAAVHVGDILTD